MTPGCDSRGRNDVRGRGGPSGGRWAGCGSTTSPTMQSSMAPSQVVLGGRKVAIRRPRVRRDGAARRIQRGAWRSTTRRSSSMPGSVYGRSCSPAWITRTSLWAVARIHPGIRRSVDPTTDRGQSYMALSKPRTTEPGSRDDRPHTGATSLQTCLVFSSPRPATVEIARHPQKKLGAAPERSRSASISGTGWRWGQSRANPSRDGFLPTEPPSEPA